MLWLSRVGLDTEALAKCWTTWRVRYLTELKRIRTSITSEWIEVHGCLSRLSVGNMTFEQAVIAAERQFNAAFSLKMFQKFGHPESWAAHSAKHLHFDWYMPK